ncbi:HAD family phosphatase [Pseudonocardia petroleophila]|uniref:HAD-IA family hydrolase n=1 Tax=Pseudonocardia petroleophila TaxID=37331 RepID=A0A7G7MPY8_9PSEU|nr:HAD-IA family hydrolase [Pseudonocardia petroleophila]QNG54849.1 HAD-IA family hydrolase [Pseudonocardia petroleophila]
MTRTVVLDVGDVLIPTGPLHESVGAGLGLDAETFRAGFGTGRAGYDLGGPAGEYWSGVVRAWGRDPEPALLAELERRDAERWTALPPGEAELVAELAAAGDRLAILSNAPAPLAAAARAASWTDPFEVIVFSAEVGLAKPDPAVFAAVEARLGPTGGIVFLDDKPANVEAARAHGWAAHVFVDVATARRDLSRRGGTR